MSQDSSEQPSQFSGAVIAHEHDPLVCKTNPPAHFGARELTPAPEEVRNCPEVPDPRASKSENAKTNPMAHSGARQSPLSTRQLAALRLLARGHGTMRVSKRLGVNRHTIARWKRDPRFLAELNALLVSLRESAVRLRAGSRRHSWFEYLANAARARPTDAQVTPLDAPVGLEAE